ncbi:hypothetical protein LIER_03922 [Lithospermum erythrorhizon]|uniref:Uncharacterized protein n=1 Tax=Lithospermum erythrorhizon TaxID=34254 RepID=A0AAV3NZK2_LITER
MKSVEVNDVDVDIVSSAAKSCDDDAEIPPPDTVLTFVDTTDIVAKETPREGETISPNDTYVMLVIDSTEEKVMRLLRDLQPRLFQMFGSVVDTIDVTEVELPNTVDVTQNQKKSKRRKHQTGDDNQIDVQEKVVEKQMPANVRPTTTGSWYPTDEDQGFNDKDVAIVTSKRKTVIGNLKIDENRTKVVNKRIHKNIILVPTEGACVMTIVETVGLYRTKLVKRVIYNLNDNDSNNGMFHKGEKGNMVVNEKTDTPEIVIPSVGVTTDDNNVQIEDEFRNMTKTRIAERGIKNGGAETVVQPTAFDSWHPEDEFRASGKNMFAVISKWLASTDIVNGRRSSRMSIPYNTLETSSVSKVAEEPSYVEQHWILKFVKRKSCTHKCARMRKFLMLSLLYDEPGAEPLISEDMIDLVMMNFMGDKVVSRRFQHGRSNTKERQLTISTYVVDTTDITTTNIIVEKNNIFAEKEVDAIKVEVGTSAPIMKKKYC